MPRDTAADGRADSQRRHPVDVGQVQASQQQPQRQVGAQAPLQVEMGFELTGGMGRRVCSASSID
jgi:hypothetical protein